MIEICHGIPYVSFSIFKKAGHVKAAVASRKGGVSTAPFDSLNMSFSTGDDPDAVRENRRRFLSLLGIAPADMVSCCQVHGTHIEVVGKKDRGRGALSLETALTSCDGLLTSDPGVPLTMNFADCTPLLFYDPVRRAGGLAHGGWRGTAGNIGGAMVRLMEERFGSRPEDILAGIGPAIGPCSFEVGRDVVDAFASLFTEAEMKELAAPEEGKEGKFLFHLPLANRLLLRRAGLWDSHIEDAGICTYCREDLFYSYRKSGGRCGRHMAVFSLDGPGGGF